MEPLAYANPATDPTLSARRSRRHAVWAILIAAGCLLSFVAVIAIWIAVGTYRVRQAIAAFDRKTSAAVILGKTAQQTITMFGPPTYDTNTDPPGTYHAPGDRVLFWYGPWGEGCRVEFSNGIATNVDHYGK